MYDEKKKAEVVALFKELTQPSEVRQPTKKKRMERHGTTIINSTVLIVPELLPDLLRAIVARIPSAKKTV